VGYHRTKKPKLLILKNNLLFQVPVKFHLAGIEAASEPDDSKNEHLLEKENDEHTGKI
jgi:hypothetical protein